MGKRGSAFVVFVCLFVFVVSVSGLTSVSPLASVHLSTWDICFDVWEFQVIDE